MTTKTGKKFWLVALREHLLDPLVRSTAPGSAGRLFSTTSFVICCKYWLSSSPDMMHHEAPSTLLQVFFWTTGYVFANTVARGTFGHLSNKTQQTPIVPAIPSINMFTPTSTANTHGTQPVQPVQPPVVPPSAPTAVPTKPAKATKTSEATVQPSKEDTVEDSDIG